MKSRTILIAILVVLILFTIGDAGFTRQFASKTTLRAAVEQKRIQFRVTTIEERQGVREVISEATIEGPPGTDFNINLEGKSFQMKARFLTDLITPQALNLRARLETRRLYGYSKNDLPLYEEDKQQQILELGFDEQVNLLPFGRQNAPDKIKIEIIPTFSQESVFLASGKLRPLEIKILRQSPNGEVSIQASRSPHNFEVETSLWEDGVEIARGVSEARIEEAREIVLQPTRETAGEVANHPLAVNLTINEYTRSRPVDFVDIAFDVNRLENHDPSRRTPLARRWAGVGALGSDIAYDLGEPYRKGSGKTYELRFKFKLAKNELTD